MWLYRLILALFGPPALLLRAGRLALTGRAEPRGLAERLALSPPRPNGPVLWLHAASNGELASAKATILAILSRHPGLSLVVTTNTATGRTLAESWRLPGLVGRLAPVDTWGATRRFLQAVRPAALIVIENELWPERLVQTAARGIPVFVLGARMSAGSERAWARFPGIARRITDAIAWLSAQDRDSARRFESLGLNKDRLGPVLNLKAAFVPDDAPAALPFPRATTLLAASTHPGEEEVILTAFASAQASNPGLRLILAPRHPRRSAEVVRLIADTGLSFAVRSKGQEPTAQTLIYLADTMGEMDRWYAGAGMTFVAGSLTDRGGHTPYEPAAHGSAILHGPDVTNSAPAYAALQAAGASVQVETARDLAAAIIRLADASIQKEMAEKARDALSAADPASMRPFLAALETALSGKPAADVHPARA
ncbi:3-deoxy-D-manno-octulosonic acid transferase [Defluviimonas sp. WL0002]|uniref:3-deoxy-D-manno-octulosonic acid transferase n=1 Tax=Albidovulum marisflavi TaxID=2984159 RepID=A0ABT2ZAC9_9RHOB|nr:glycosyltransferase N-terminal domain-containing protein [Defluviimonas sp. WL0002]MCV2868061.1 3-deoxy-D-manno-octulosonic acid transferase [Defluviimonas sp. WL0002]